MFFKTALVSAMALLAGTAMSAPAPAEQNILIATDAYSACNCPNNCSYEAGHSCKYYSTPSNTGPIYDGSKLQPATLPMRWMTDTVYSLRLPRR